MSNNPAQKKDPLVGLLDKPISVRFSASRVERGVVVRSLPRGLDLNLGSASAFFVFKNQDRIYVAPILSSNIERGFEEEVILDLDIPVAPRNPRQFGDKAHVEAYDFLQRRLSRAYEC